MKYLKNEICFLILLSIVVFVKGKTVENVNSTKPIKLTEVKFDDNDTIYAVAPYSHAEIDCSTPEHKNRRCEGVNFTISNSRKFKINGPKLSIHSENNLDIEYYWKKGNSNLLHRYSRKEFNS